MLVGKTYSTLCLFLSFGFCIIVITTGCTPQEASPTAPTATAGGQGTTAAESAETTVHAVTVAPPAPASVPATTSGPTPTTASSAAPPSPTPLPCPDNVPQSTDAPPAAADTPVTWVDGERFLYLSAPQPDGSGTRLRLLLGSVNGSVQQIGTVSGQFDTYHFTR